MCVCVSVYVRMCLSVCVGGGGGRFVSCDTFLVISRQYKLVVHCALCLLIRTLLAICRGVRGIFKKEPRLLRLASPTYILGEIPVTVCFCSMYCLLCVCVCVCVRACVCVCLFVGFL